MIIELNDDDTRLLHTILLEQAQQHLSYAGTSEVAERLYKLATRFVRPLENVPHRLHISWTMSEVTRNARGVRRC
jgi:hypothetical protein